MFNVPSLAFQCTIAKMRPAIHGQFENDWAKEANDIFKDHCQYPKILIGTVSIKTFIRWAHTVEFYFNVHSHFIICAFISY